MSEADYYSEAAHGPHEIFELGNYQLESGITLPNARIAYKTHGTLNEAKDNVVLFPHMWSGIWSVMGLCQEFYRQEAWREVGFTSLQDFLHRFWEAYFAPMDPNNLIWMGWKWRHGDVSRHTGGDLAAALGRIKAKTYVVPFSRDMFFPPDDCGAEQKLIPNCIRFNLI
jgi:homoserine acetyltransferase